MSKSIVRREGVDKSALRSSINREINALLELEPETVLEAERAVRAVVLGIGRVLLAVVLAQMCRRVTVRELEGRGLSLSDVRLRLDANYSVVLATSLGEIVVPLFAYRQQAKGGTTTTRSPARHILPWYPRCRSSPLLLRFETTLGSRMPFREAERMLALMTDGAVTLHDTTIAHHCRHVAEVVSREHMYLSPEEIRQVLVDRAVRDPQTDLPIVHFSTDGHAERLLDGPTWERNWRMLNGIRVWCVDKRTGRCIPLGGEFIVGDCHAVAQAFDDLNDLGILPFDGDYGEGVSAQLVFIADGMEWFDEHVLAKFPNVEAILDAYHVLEKVGELFADLWGSGSRRAKRAYRKFCRWVTGRTPSKQPDPKPRKQQKEKKGDGKIMEKEKKQKARAKREAAYDRKRSYPSIKDTDIDDLDLPKHSGGELLAAFVSIVGDASDARIEGVIDYLAKRLDRIRYRGFWHRGFHISSSAMESFNRVAQQRIKLPGAAWTPAMAQAILNLRMVSVSGNQDRFWNDDKLMQKLGHLWRTQGLS